MTGANKNHDLHDVLLIDDLRVFRRPIRSSIARTSAQGLDLLRDGQARGHRWEQIWLDHDLGDMTGVVDTIAPVVDWLGERAHDGSPVPVGTLVVHTTNAPAGTSMVQVLRRAGYRVVRVQATDYLDVDPALHAQATATTGSDA